MKVSLLIPTLNEVEGLKQIMPRIKNEWVDQILVADGGSTDGTIEYLREAGYPFFIQRNRGLRYAYIEAIGLLQAEVVITFSPDGNSVPELIPELIEKMKDGYDMVIVSRYKDEAKSYDDDRITAFGNWLFTKMINLLHKGKYTDSLVMFRAWRKDIFKELGLDQEASYAAEE